MCGSDSGTIKAVIEGVELNVCQKCSRFGKILVKPRIKFQQKEDHHAQEEEIIEMISPDYSDKIKKARESLNLNQEDLAKKLNERESFLHKIESGHIEPSIMVAKKLESFLNIKLIEKHRETYEKKEKSRSDSLTIGDMIKIKNKQ